MHIIPADLQLRPLTAADAPVLAAWADDPVFLAAAGWSADRSRDSLVRFWELMASEPPPELTRLAAEVHGQLVGYGDLHGTSPERRELGFLVGPSNQWGRGLGRTIAAGTLVRAWETQSVQEVWAETHPANDRAIGVVRALGMTETGEGDVEEFLGEPARMLQFGVRRDRWFAGAARS